MRKALFAIVALLVTACGHTPSDLLLLRTVDALAVMDPIDGTVTFTASHAFPSSDWSRVFQVQPGRNSSRIAALDPGTGAETWSADARNGNVIGAVSSDGSLAALIEPPVNTKDGYPEGSETTVIAITGPGAGGASRALTLRGNFRPEAFSTDRKALFAVEYVPPRRPDRYRVRRIDLDTGTVNGVFSVDGHLQNAMRGSARTQALAPDGKRLYTLYWLADDTGPADSGHAFVHVLSLDQQWAHCVSLPRPIGSHLEGANVLALSPDGNRLYVGDGEKGKLAEIDTKALRVTRTASIPMSNAGALRSAVGSDGTLYMSRGRRVAAVDTESMRPAAWWSFPSDVTGIQPAIDGRRIYVALTNRVNVVDTRTGRTTATFPAIGMNGIDQLGAVSAGLDTARTQILCAC
jgi:hypothetical protein